MKPSRAAQHRLAGEPRGFGAAIDAVAEAHEAAVPHQAAQRAQHLVLAAEIAELARQEHVLAPLAGDPFLDPFAQCLPSGIVQPFAKTRHSIYKNPTFFKGKQHFINVLCNQWLRARVRASASCNSQLAANRYPPMNARIGHAYLMFIQKSVVASLQKARKFCSMFSVGSISGMIQWIARVSLVNSQPYLVGIVPFDAQSDVSPFRLDGERHISFGETHLSTSMFQEHDANGIVIIQCCLMVTKSNTHPM